MGIPNIEDVLISLHNDFETNDKLQDKVYELEEQLQAYKDKEDKLREYIDRIPMSCHCGQTQQEEIENNILQILNEGELK